MASNKIDFGPRTWAAHAQDHFLDLAGNPNFPDYLRLVFVAYARHAASGHALLERGELAGYLVRKDGALPDRRVIWSALQKAIRLGYLLPTSQLLCLVVSSEHVQGGDGSPDKRCPRDHSKGSSVKTNVRRDHGRFATNVGNGARRSAPNVGDGDRRSTLAPSLFSLPSPSERDAS